MRHIVTKIFVLCFSFLTFHTLYALHNASRYFPFFERPDNYTSRKRPYVGIAPFYSTAATAYKRGGGAAGIHELWGRYDLQDVIRSLQAVSRPQVPNPIEVEIGSPEFNNKSIKFKVDGKVKAVGLMLNYEHDLQWRGLSFGFWMPIMQATATSRYGFNKSDFVSQLTRPLGIQELARLDNLIDKIRRNTHEHIGFKENRWEQGGIGDLDAHVRWNYFADHELMMRTINIDTQLGCVFPTGVRSEVKNPLSVPFMGGGHWGLYGEIVPEFELKQDLKIGFMLGATYQAKNQRTVRIPVYKEPAIFSSLVGRVDINPGSTLKLSSYVILENVVDGLNFQARYTYLRHARDTWKDIREDQTIPSYLTLKPTDAVARAAAITQENIAKNIAEKESLSKWRSHYITLQLVYDSKQALHNWSTDPNFYVTYDIPFGGNGISKNHQVTFGIELHF